MSNTVVTNDCAAVIDAIIQKLGKNIAIGMPLGLGKPYPLINGLFARACQDSSLNLKILTALSLEKPTPSSATEAAFLGPFLDRVWGDCPDLDYALAVRKNRVPANVEVIEFFFKPGAFMGTPSAQMNYISSNYTFAARDVFNNGCNLAAQAIAKRVVNGKVEYSLSANPDTGTELIDRMKAAGRPHMVIGVVNEKLPFMEHDALVPASMFDYILDDRAFDTQLFCTPKMPVTTPDYMIGLNASSLIKDGGTLQIGIGALGDAIVYSAILRHQQNEVYRQALEETGILSRNEALIAEYGGTATFQKGLYGATEMFVDGMLDLYKAGILKRKVYDDTELQRLINQGRCSDQADLNPEVLDHLEAEGVRIIRTKDFQQLQYHGLFSDECRYDLGHIIAPDGERIMANLAIPESRAALKSKCLGKRLRNGILLHAGFFLGPNAFYQGLRDMSDEERRQICMTSVYKINQLDADPDLYKEQRLHARFINTGILVNLLGAAASDTLEDHRVVSGVGGQYNFVSMAHKLPTGRSVLMFRSVREGAESSNVVWNYGNCTIPRHLRDLVITEYGIADLRSMSDSECIKRMLNITDSRFQDGLLAQAKKARKIDAGYQIPDAFRQNTPAKLEAMLAPGRKRGLFPAFPLGCDLTSEELKLGKALKGVKAQAAATAKWKLALRAVTYGDGNIPASAQPYLQRMKLTAPQTTQDKVVRMLLVENLKSDGAL